MKFIVFFLFLFHNPCRNNNTDFIKDQKRNSNKICENTSGGVIIAATMKITTIACFLYFLIKWGNDSDLCKEKSNYRSSKTTPVARQIEVIVPIYDLILIWLTTSALIW